MLVRSQAELTDQEEKVCLDFSVDSVSEAAPRLKAAGLSLELEEADLLQVRDPDGNLVEFVHG